jgi:hypothetical protein
VLLAAARRVSGWQRWFITSIALTNITRTHCHHVRCCFALGLTTLTRHDAADLHPSQSVTNGVFQIQPAWAHICYVPAAAASQRLRRPKCIKEGTFSPAALNRVGSVELQLVLSK